MNTKFQSLFRQSTPESWAQFSHDNITRAEHERMASIQLRTLIDNILNDTSRDMREQADAVDVSFQKRVDEVQDSKHKLDENLKKVRISFYNTYLPYMKLCTQVYLEQSQKSSQLGTKFMFKYFVVDLRGDCKTREEHR